MAMPEPAPPAPKAFISYSWDDDAHKEWVKQLAIRLRADGVDVMLDRWHAEPGDQIPAFMERAVCENNFVITVCTPRFKERSDGRGGGVGYEGDIMTAYAFTGGDKRKFIPVLRRGIWSEAAPAWLLGRAKIDLSSDPYSESEYEELLRTLHRAREEAPPIGPRPSFEDKNGSPASPAPAAVTLLVGSSTPQHQLLVTPGDLRALFQMPEVWNKVVRFEEVFRAACNQIERVSECKMLHDKLQELQNVYRNIDPLLRRGAGTGEPDWDNLDVEGQNLLWLLDDDDLVKAARGVSSAAKECLWIAKLEAAVSLFSQAVAHHDKVKLNAACAIIDETIVKRLSVYNRCLIEAVGVLDLQLLVDCLSEIRRKLEGIPLDENASRQREGFIERLDALTEISEKWKDQVARHDEFQNIEDELTSAHGAIREDFDTFLILWAPVCEVIRARGATPGPSRSGPRPTR